ncbi:PA containing protein [Pseudonocardia bannensis]|uniref:PA containing protein n=1 Tax=Pseudonocardia bannensis TaxID=630973 RepID=A0A848DP36_9PSEU|nr:PA containing protein [Pseudonocardia bannensis]NMH94600.1 PA containing protein [Pseudonocardia bannensis]
MSDNSTLSFDRMRGMLMRAAEIRDSEQQQIFDSLDEIHARLTALDALGAMRKRLTELPDRTEVSVLAERLDETVAKLDAQDAALASLTRAVESLPDKLAKPFAQLDGRLDGMAGRLEGVSGRMDGLDDRLGGLHKRLDDLDNRLDRHEMRLDAMPNAVATPIRERVDGVERMVREQLDGALRSFDETGDGLRNLLGDTSVGLHRRLEDLASRPAVDPTEALDALAERLEALATRLESVAGRVDAVEDGLAGRLGLLGGSLDQGLGKLDAAVSDRPDTATVTALVAKAHEDSERRNAGQLDEAMATFAELILGRGPSVQTPPPPPRPTQRRATRAKATVKSSNGASASDTVTDDPDD